MTRGSKSVIFGFIVCFGVFLNISTEIYQQHCWGNMKEKMLTFGVTSCWERMVMYINGRWKAQLYLLANNTRYKLYKKTTFRY